MTNFYCCIIYCIYWLWISEIQGMNQIYILLENLYMSKSLNKQFRKLLDITELLFLFVLINSA